MSIFFHARSSFMLAMFAIALSGCSSEPLPDGMPTLTPVTLTLAQGGVPLEGASVQLIPLDKSNSTWSAGGVSNDEGKVVIQTLGKYEGAANGRYKVTVYKMVIEGDSPDAIDSPSSMTSSESYIVVDPRFHSPETTPLEVEVASSQTELPPIDLGVPVKLKQEIPG